MVDLRLCVAALLLVVTWATAVHSQDSATAADALFTVRDVAVDETAQSANQARERALQVGQRAAFTRLMNRLTVSSDRARLGSIDDATIQSLVRDIEISGERTSTVRYLAKISVRFNPSGVRQRLGNAGVPMVETPSPPMVVLPVYGPDGRAVLWDDPNPWRDAWNNATSMTGLVPLILPVGDVADMDDIGAEQALAADAERLRAIAQRYGAADAVVVRARLDAGGQNLQVSAMSGARGKDPILSESMRVANAAELPAVMNQAIGHVVAALDDRWKREFSINPGDAQRLSVTVPLESLADWLEVRRRLSGVATLRQSTLVALSQREALLDLGFVGNPQQLRSALAQRRLQLSGSDNAWVLELMRATSAPAATPAAAPAPGPDASKSTTTDPE